eukprot:scaffold32279_cov109-Isochrysis_galbana.AAC.2
MSGGARGRAPWLRSSPVLALALRRVISASSSNMPVVRPLTTCASWLAGGEIMLYIDVAATANNKHMERLERKMAWRMAYKYGGVHVHVHVSER